MLRPMMRQAQACRTNSSTGTSSHLILILHSQLTTQEEQAPSSRVGSASSWRDRVMMIARLRLVVLLEEAFADDL